MIQSQCAERCEINENLQKTPPSEGFFVFGSVGFIGHLVDKNATYLPLRKVDRIRLLCYNALGVVRIAEGGGTHKIFVWSSHPSSAMRAIDLKYV